MKTVLTASRAMLWSIVAFMLVLACPAVSRGQDTRWELLRTRTGAPWAGTDFLGTSWVGVPLGRSTSAAHTGRDLHFEFRAEAGRLDLVESSTDLVEWKSEFAPVATNGFVAVDIPVDDRTGHRFYRVRSFWRPAGF